MVIQLRRVRKEAMKGWADKFPEGKTATLPTWDLTDDSCTEPFTSEDGSIPLVPESFLATTSRLGFVKALESAVGRSLLEKIETDEGAKMWLSALYQEGFRDYKNSEWATKELARFQVSSDWKKAYRHDIGSILRLYLTHGNNAGIFLDGPICQRSDVFHHFQAKPDQLDSTEVVRALNILFGDSRGDNKVRSGLGKGRPAGYISGCTGRLTGPRSGYRRFALLLDRLNRTVDVLNFPAEHIIALMGDEFDWTGHKERSGEE